MGTVTTLPRDRPACRADRVSGDERSAASTPYDAVVPPASPDA